MVCFNLLCIVLKQIKKKNKEKMLFYIKCKIIILNYFFFNKYQRNITLFKA